MPLGPAPIANPCPNWTPFLELLFDLGVLEVAFGRGSGPGTAAEDVDERLGSLSRSGSGGGGDDQQGRKAAEEGSCW